MSPSERSWSTAGVPSARLRDFWPDAVCRAINDVDIRIEDSETFSASLRQRKLGPLAMSHIDVHGSQIVRRTRSIIARSNPELFSVIHLLEGQGWVRQRSREVAFRQDECIIVDNREPYEIAILGRGESLSIHMPATWLAQYVREARLVVAEPLPRSRPWAGRLMDLMHAAHTQTPAELCAEVFASHFGSTLALAVGGLTEACLPESPNGFHALQATLQELACAPNLRAEEVAGAHGISARQLHHVYAAQGTTFRSELMRLRLERARAMLLDARFRSVPVEEIARRCGFSDTRHFRRRFSQQFGVSPAALRQ